MHAGAGVQSPPHLPILRGGAGVDLSAASIRHAVVPRRIAGRVPVRRGLEHWLREADLRRHGLPANAIAIVRELRVTWAQVAGPTESLRHDTLGAILRGALRPALEHGAIGVTSAVWFADESELLACMARDAIAGPLSARWWWPALLHGDVDGAAAIRHWIASARTVPRAAERLQAMSVGAAWFEELGRSSAPRLAGGAHPASPAVGCCAALRRSGPDRGGRGASQRCLRIRRCPMVRHTGTRRKAMQLRPCRPCSRRRPGSITCACTWCAIRRVPSMGVTSNASCGASRCRRPNVTPYSAVSHCHSRVRADRRWCRLRLPPACLASARVARSPSPTAHRRGMMFELRVTGSMRRQDTPPHRSNASRPRLGVFGPMTLSATSLIPSRASPRRSSPIVPAPGRALLPCSQLHSTMGLPSTPSTAACSSSSLPRCSWACTATFRSRCIAGWTCRRGSFLYETGLAFGGRRFARDPLAAWLKRGANPDCGRHRVRPRRVLAH